MAKTRKQKEELVDAITDSLKNDTSVFVGFTGISVAQETSMRRAMREDGLGYRVVKKSLLRRALQALGHEAPDLPGEVALAYTTTSKEATAPAQKVHAFGKEFGADKISILGGIFEGTVVAASMMQELATIPSLDALRGMFANVINSPRQRFAVVLSKVAETKN